VTKTLDKVLREIQDRKDRDDRATAVKELKEIANSDWGNIPSVEVPKVIFQGLANHIYRLEEELGKAKKQLQNPPHTVSIVQPEVTVNKSKPERKFQVGDIVSLKNPGRFSVKTAKWKVTGYSTTAIKADRNGVELEVVEAGDYDKIGDHAWNPEDGLELVKKAEKPKFQVGDRVRSIFNPYFHYIVTGPKNSRGDWPVQPNSANATDTTRKENVTERVPLSEFTYEDIQKGDTVEYKNIRYVITEKSSEFRTLFAQSPDSRYSVMFNEHDLQVGLLKVVDTPQ
jgi:hypothetical protein